MPVEKSVALCVCFFLWSDFGEADFMSTTIIIIIIIISRHDHWGLPPSENEQIYFSRFIMLDLTAVFRLVRMLLLFSLPFELILYNSNRVLLALNPLACVSNDLSLPLGCLARGRVPAEHIMMPPTHKSWSHISNIFQ